MNTRYLPRLILASQSPRRRELLAEAGYEFDVLAPSDSAEDDIRPNESPEEFVLRLAQQKAHDVARRLTTNSLILACDTVAECGGAVLGKPADRRHAAEMLRRLRGTEHRVLSGICLWRRPDDRRSARVAATVLRMDDLSDSQLDEYLESGLWQGKAGAFGYQDRAGWLHVVRGSESNVVGLPMELLAEMLDEFADPQPRVH